MRISFKLREKLILITVCTILLVIVVNTYLNISDFIRVYKERVIERVFIQIQPLKTTIEDIIVLGLELADLEEINRECRNLAKTIDYTLYCFVTDNQGQVLFHSSSEEVGSVYSNPATQTALASQKKQVQVYTLASGEKIYDFALPFEKPNGERVGLIRLGIQYRIINEEVSRLIQRAVLLGMITLFLGGLIVFLLSEYNILRPARQLMAGITKFGRGELESRVQLKTKDEIGELAKSFNSMASSIVSYITERKKAEEELLLTKARLQHLLISSPAVIYSRMPAPGFTFSFVSDNVEMQFGYKPKEFLENPPFWFSQIHKEDFEIVSTGLSSLLQRGHHIHEYRLKHKNGSYPWVRDEMQMIYDANKNPVEIVGYWIDIH